MRSWISPALVVAGLAMLISAAGCGMVGKEEKKAFGTVGTSIGATVASGGMKPAPTPPPAPEDKKP